MRLELFKTLWGDARPWPHIITELRAAAFDGIEARIPDSATDAADKGRLLQQEGVPYIGIALTGGGVIPRQNATLADHLTDLRHALDRAATMASRFVNVLGGNDRWGATQQADFINQAHEIGQQAADFQEVTRIIVGDGYLDRLNDAQRAAVTHGVVGDTAPPRKA